MSSSEDKRVREVRKYYANVTAIDGQGPAPPTNPPTKDQSREASGPAHLRLPQKSSPDTTLTAFTQLVTWRLDVQRAVVALVDRTEQVSRNIIYPPEDPEDPEDSENPDGPVFKLLLPC